VILINKVLNKIT